MGLKHVAQSGIQFRKMDKPHEAMQTDKLLRGVVLATYLLDDLQHPYAVGDPTLPKPVSVYCDVLCYSNINGMKWTPISKAMVVQDKGNMHSGRVWKPRATTIDVSGLPYLGNGGTNPANMDGDHVLIGFLEGLKNKPIILGGIPHPSRDLGNELHSAGHRTYLKVIDGDPDFFKHHGSYYGIDDTGAFVANTTMANAGILLPDGTEPPPPIDGSGCQTRYLPQHAEHRIEFDDMTNPDLPLPVRYGLL